ncbi:hypothetical protein ACH4E7_26725 [Kitasatospora sp. NPDC018058]|uniref:hypothetical protein n=1 Tax=Kitasatospora sp. NPDC018058 TaxID=3364025 RepID=UPI0037BEC47B
MTEPRPTAVRLLEPARLRLAEAAWEQNRAGADPADFPRGRPPSPQGLRATARYMLTRSGP